MEALTKTEFYFKHLDDRVIKVSYEDIIKPNQKLLVNGEGMHGQTHNGDLVIYFDIIFPQSLEKERSKYLVKILPLPKKQIWDLQFESMPKEEITELNMKYIDEANIDSNENENSEKNNSFDDENDEDTRRDGFGGGRPIECATQ